MEITTPPALKIERKNLTKKSKTSLKLISPQVSNYSERWATALGLNRERSMWFNLIYVLRVVSRNVKRLQQWHKQTTPWWFHTCGGLVLVLRPLCSLLLHYQVHHYHSTLSSQCLSLTSLHTHSAKISFAMASRWKTARYKSLPNRASVSMWIPTSSSNTKLTKEAKLTK